MAAPTISDTGKAMKGISTVAVRVDAHALIAGMRNSERLINTVTLPHGASGRTFVDTAEIVASAIHQRSLIDKGASTDFAAR